LPAERVPYADVLAQDARLNRDAGVDVDRPIADTERCLAELERVGAGGLERFDRSLNPRVEWLTESG
jgi:hypothetical protein